MAPLDQVAPPDQVCTCFTPRTSCGVCPAPSPSATLTIMSLYVLLDLSDRHLMLRVGYLPYYPCCHGVVILDSNEPIVSSYLYVLEFFGVFYWRKSVPFSPDKTLLPSAAFFWEPYHPIIQWYTEARPGSVSYMQCYFK